MSDSNLTQFQGRKYLNLETFRKNGQGVPTTVWFAESEGVLYVRTLANSGKVKRIRNGGIVRIVPSDAIGSPLGDWIEGRAYFMDENDAQKISRLFNRKYGLQKTLFDLVNRFNKGKWETIAIEINSI